jgi:hypothetical protein
MNHLYGVPVRAVLLEVSEAMLAKRSGLGLDGRDEIRSGVPHLVPPDGGPHQRLGTQLFGLIRLFGLLAEGQGLTSLRRRVWFPGPGKLLAAVR